MSNLDIGVCPASVLSVMIAHSVRSVQQLCGFLVL